MRSSIIPTSKRVRFVGKTVSFTFGGVYLSLDRYFERNILLEDGPYIYLCEIKRHMPWTVLSNSVSAYFWCMLVLLNLINDGLWRKDYGVYGRETEYTRDIDSLYYPVYYPNKKTSKIFMNTYQHYVHPR